MKSVRILVAFALVALSLVAQAEVYKWKDKDGVVRYSDTPPNSNVKSEMVGKKKALATPIATTAVTTTKPAANPLEVPVPETPDMAAQKRRDLAEVEKKNKIEKEAEAKRKADNCSVAKSNMQAHTQGGRVYKTNEKGEREYMDEKGFEEGKRKAQQEINENC